jgi:hypothetical protein
LCSVWTSIHFCATAAVGVPFKLLFSNSTATRETVPWNEYFSPAELGPLPVMTPINWPVAALYNVSTAP